MTASRRPLILVVLVTGWLAISLVAREKTPVVVRTESGPVTGTADGAINTFRGIPYARPPVGDLRWKPPQAPVPWSAPRPATTFGNACPQRIPVPMVDGGEAAQSEDCLTLNVWAPAHMMRPAPVLVWIHGGGNTEGAAFRQYYDGLAFARDGLVFVSANYRVGILGFFAHPALTHAAGPNEPLGTFGLMDQMAVLQWVKRNAAAFGGDPTEVTVFGESAGGTDILDLMTAQSATGLFERAIVESAGFLPYSLTLPAAEREGQASAASAGLGATATAADLRHIPLAEIAKLGGGLAGPIVDQRLLTETPVDALSHGRFVHVPLVIGTNSDEGSLRGETLPPAEVLDAFSAAELTALRAAYGGSLDDAALARALFRDLNFAAPSRWVAGRSSASAPTYLYQFSYLRRSQRGHVPGASHGSEIPYVFDSWAQAPGGGALLPAEDRAEATRLHACWVAFAKTGVPACGEAEAWPAWPRYSPASDTLIDLGVTTRIIPTPNREALRIAERRFVPGGGH